MKPSEQIRRRSKELFKEEWGDKEIEGLTYYEYIPAAIMQFLDDNEKSI